MVIELGDAAEFGYHFFFFNPGHLFISSELKAGCVLEVVLGPGTMPLSPVTSLQCVVCRGRQQSQEPVHCCQTALYTGGCWYSCSEVLLLEVKVTGGPLASWLTCGCPVVFSSHACLQHICVLVSWGTPAILDLGLFQ